MYGHVRGTMNYMGDTILHYYTFIYHQVIVYNTTEDGRVLLSYLSAGVDLIDVVSTGD